MGTYRFKRPLVYPQQPPAGMLGNTWTYVSSLIDASTEKVAFIGQFWSNDGTSKTISRVGFRTGTVSLNAASYIKTSIQSVSTTAGPPYQPTGTILGATSNGFITEAASGFASDSWHRTGAFGETVTLAHGDMIAVVVEYGTFTAADSFNLTGLTESSGANQLTGGAALYTGTWAVQASLPLLVLEDSGGGFHSLQSAIPLSAVNVATFAQDDATADEWALEFIPGVTVGVSGAWFVAKTTSVNSNVDVVLYDSGGTALATVSIDGNAVASNGSYRYFYPVFSSEVTLTAGQTYRLAIKPTTTGSNAVGVYQVTVDDAGHWDVWGFWNAGLVKRIDGGSWGSKTTTSRFIGGLLISSIQDGKVANAGLQAIEQGICA